jgi:hypothetical protein
MSGPTSFVLYHLLSFGFLDPFIDLKGHSRNSRISFASRLLEPVKISGLEIFKIFS